MQDWCIEISKTEDRKKLELRRQGYKTEEKERERERRIRSA
jgi:hypothetical protein